LEFRDISRVSEAITGAYNLDNGWRYGLDANGAPIGNGNGYLGINGHVTDDVT